MAYTNLPQNTSYTGTPQDDGNLNLTPNLSAYNALTSMRNSAWAPSGVTPTIVPNSPEDLLNRRLDTYKNLSSLGGGTGVPSGMQITSPNSMSDRTPIPADYSNFAKTGSFSKDGINIAWQTPVSPVIRNQPGDVNGQYIEDTANPDALIKTERTPNSLLDRAIRAGRPGVDWQIDHIVPLALGGADTLQNRQLLSDIENDQKTKAQSVAYTLFAYGKLSQRDARNMAARWKDIDTSDIPEPDKYGMVPAEEGGLFSHLPWVKQRTALEVAQDAQKKWTEPKKVTVMDVIKGIPAAIPEGAKNFGEGWLPDPIREFVKGVASGGTLGFLPHEYTPEEGALSKITGTAGEILGSLAPWSRVAAFIKIPMAAVGLRKAYVYGNLAKEAPSFFKFFNPLTKEAAALRAAAKPLYEKHLLETASVGGNAFVKGTIMGKPAAEVAADMIGTFKSTVPPSILRRFFADPSLREQTAIFSLASVAVGIASRTIATKLSPQILAGEEMAQDEKDTLKNIMKDLVFGAIPGAQSNTLKGTIYAASLPATLSWLSDPDNPLDALVNGAVFGAMHLHSSTRGFTKFDNFNDVEAIGGKQYNDPYLAAYDTAVGHGAHEILYTWNAGSKDIKKADPRGPVPIYTPEKIDSLVRSAQKNIQLALTNNDPVSVQKLRTLKKDLTSALAQDEYSPNNFGNLSQYVTAKGRATLQEKNATELERQGKINKAIEKSQKFRKGKEPSDPIGYETARKEMLRVVMAGRHLYKMGLPTTEGTVGKNGVIGKIRYREDLNDIFSMTAKQNEVRGDEIFKSIKTPDSLHYAAYAILKTNKGSILTSRLPSTGNIKDMTMITGGDENNLIEYQNALEEKRASPLLLFVKEPSYKYPLTIKNKYVPELYKKELAEGTASIDPHPETAIGAYALIAPKEGTKPNIVKLGYIASGYRLDDGLYAINKKHKGPGEFGLTKEVASKVMKQNGLDVMIMSHEMMSKEGIESGHAYIFAGMSPTSIEASKMLHQEMVKNGYVKPLNELVDNYNLSSQKNRIATDGPADAVSDKKDLIDHPERKTASQYIKTFPKGSKQEGHEIATKNIVDASAEVLSSAKTEEDVIGGLEKSLGFRIPITDARFLLQNKNEKGNNITTIPEINNIIQKTVSDPQNDVSPVAKRKADLMDNFIKSGAIRITSPIGDAVVEIPIVGNKPSEVPPETVSVTSPDNHTIPINESLLPIEEHTQIEKIKSALSKNFPTEIANSVTIVYDNPLSGIPTGADLSTTSHLSSVGVKDPFARSFAIKNQTKIKIGEIKSESDLAKAAAQKLAERQSVGKYPDLVNEKTLKDNFSEWVQTLNNNPDYPIYFKEIMMDVPVEGIRGTRINPYVAPVSKVALRATYDYLQQHPSEIVAARKVYKDMLIEQTTESVGHEPSASGKGHWIHIPRTEGPLKYTGFVEKVGDDFVELSNNEKIPINSITSTDGGSFLRDIIEESAGREGFGTGNPNHKYKVGDKIEWTDSEGKNFDQFDINVKMLRRLSPETWCTNSWAASDYVKKFDNYLLIVDGKTVAGVEILPPRSLAPNQPNVPAEVNSVTSVANDGIAPVDHLDDILAFLKKHDISDKDREGSINRAKRIADPKRNKYAVSPDDVVAEEEYFPFSKTSQGKTEGYYDLSSDKAVLIAKNLTPERAREVALHELTHRGLVRTANEVGGLGELHNILQSAKTELMKASPDLLKRTGHTSIDELVADYGFDINTKEGETKLLSELAARWSEKFANIPHEEWWKTLIIKLHDWIKQFIGKDLDKKGVDMLISGFLRRGITDTPVAEPQKTKTYSKKTTGKSDTANRISIANLAYNYAKYPANTNKIRNNRNLTVENAARLNELTSETRNRTLSKDEAIEMEKLYKLASVKNLPTTRVPTIVKNKTIEKDYYDRIKTHIDVAERRGPSGRDGEMGNEMSPDTEADFTAHSDSSEPFVPKISSIKEAGKFAKGLIDSAKRIDPVGVHGIDMERMKEAALPQIRRDVIFKLSEFYNIPMEDATKIVDELMYKQEYSTRIKTKDLEGKDTYVNDVFTVDSKKPTYLPNGYKLKYGPLNRKREDGSPVYASTDHKNREIKVDKESILMTFKNKPWTKPEVDGVDPLPEDAIKTDKDWLWFNILHELYHSGHKKNIEQTTASVENAANESALHDLKIVNSFKDAPWTKPTKDGVKPLPKNAFKNEFEWLDFNHELNFLNRTIKRRKNESDSNFWNRIIKVAQNKFFNAPTFSKTIKDSEYDLLKKGREANSSDFIRFVENGISKPKNSYIYSLTSTLEKELSSQLGPEWKKDSDARQILGNLMTHIDNTLREKYTNIDTRRDLNEVTQKRSIVNAMATGVDRKFADAVQERLDQLDANPTEITGGKLDERDLADKGIGYDELKSMTIKPTHQEEDMITGITKADYEVLPGLSAIVHSGLKETGNTAIKAGVTDARRLLEVLIKANNDYVRTHPLQKKHTYMSLLQDKGYTGKWANLTKAQKDQIKFRTEQHFKKRYRDIRDGRGGPGFHDGKGGIGDMWNSIKTGLKKTLDPLMPARRWEFVNPQPLDHPVKPIDQFGPDNLAKAIGSHETETLYDNNNKPYKPKDDAERYSYVQPFSKAIGYYQVEEPTLATYAPKVLGRTVTTEEFRNNRELQDLFARKYLEHLIKNVKLTPKQAVIAWNRGINGDPNSQDAKDYWDKVNRYLNYTGV